jgi:hypothetical protein
MKMKTRLDINKKLIYSFKQQMKKHNKNRKKW